MKFFQKTNSAENSFRRQLFDDIAHVENKLQRIQESFDMTDEPELVESLIYEELALKARYAYLLRIAKQNNICCRISVGE